MAKDRLIARRDAAQATLDRFGGVPFGYGHHDCARMVMFHLAQLGIAPKLPKAARYASALGARKALKRLGHDDLPAMIDAYGFERIAPASAIVGDLIALPAVDPMGAITIALGNGRVIGYHEDVLGAAVLQPAMTEAAWRVLPHV